MEFLRRESFVWFALVLSLGGCGGTVTKTIPLETDTFITTDVLESRAELPYTQVSRFGALEDRTILKLPTTDKDEEEVIEEVWEKTFAFIFLMPFSILAAFANCDVDMFNAATISNAVLKIDVTEDLETMADDKVSLTTLSRPWWQTVSWTKAHPFSKEGMWSTPGGDIDPSFTPVLGKLSTSGSVKTISFTITDYYKALALANGGAAHYGFVIQPVSSSMNPVKFASVQASSFASRPRLEVSYPVTCKRTSSGSSWWNGGTRTTTYLGRDPVVVTEQLP